MASRLLQMFPALYGALAFNGIAWGILALMRSAQSGAIVWLSIVAVLTGAIALVALLRWYLLRRVMRDLIKELDFAEEELDREMIERG